MKKQILFCILILSELTVTAQWHQCNAFFGGSVNCFAKNGTDIFAGTKSGLYLSTNKGISWSLVNNYYTDYEIYAIAIKDSNIYVGTINDIFLSTNYGNSWTSIKNSLPIDANQKIIKILVKDSILIVGTGSVIGCYTLFKSINNGASWTQPTGILSETNIYDLVVKDTLFFASTGKGIYISTDKGDSWNTANNGLPSNYDFLDLEIVGNKIYTTAFGLGIYLSNNNGLSWLSVNSGAPSYIYSITSHDSIIFIGSNGYGIYRSNNYGNSWTYASNGLTSNVIRILEVIDTTIFAGVSGNGVNRSIDNGNNWSVANNGLILTSISALTSSGINILAATNNGNYLSHNNVNLWSSTMQGLNITELSADGSNICASTNGSGEYFSNDNGNNWSSVNNGISSTAQIFSTVINGNKLYAGVWGHGIYFSNNYGASWSNIYSFSPYLIGSTALACNSTNVFAVLDYGAVLTSTDNVNWSNIPITSVRCFHIVGDKIFAGTTNGLYVSNDNGTSWALKSNNVANAITSSGSNIFAACNNGVFLSLDTGNTWFTVNDGLLYKKTSAIAICGINIYVGTSGSGVWYRQLSEMLSIIENQNDNLIYNIYPNPTKDKISISNNSIFRQEVIVNIYTITGQKILTEIFKNIIELDVSKFEKGIYLINIQTNGKIQNSKLIIE